MGASPREGGRRVVGVIGGEGSPGKGPPQSVSASARLDPRVGTGPSRLRQRFGGVNLAENSPLLGSLEVGVVTGVSNPMSGRSFSKTRAGGDDAGVVGADELEGAESKQKDMSSLS